MGVAVAGEARTGGRVQPGGLVILDECREDPWPGATLAIDEAFTDMAYRPSWDELLHRYVARVPLVDLGT